jgi:hypothetical protein
MIMCARFAAILIAGAITFQSYTVLARETGPSSLPDRLQRRGSADFALAGERAELEPSYRMRGLGLDFEGTKPNSHFYTWDVIPSWGEGIDYFAVDRRTGDVWAYLGCRLLRSRELTILQTRFRQRFDVSAWQVRMIEKEGFPGAC